MEASTKITVHKINQGVVKSKFVLHPAYARLAKGIEQLNGAKSGSTVEKIIDPVISRETFLRVMAQHPDGLLVQELCEALLQQTKSKLSVDDIRARVYAMLVREVNRGLVEPDRGKGKRRKLTPAGLAEAAEIEKKANQNAQSNIPKERAPKEMLNKSVAPNGVFDYAQKVSQGVIKKEADSKSEKGHDE